VEACISNRPEERKRLLQALQDFAGESHLPDKVLQAADLALEEHLTNVITYGYADELSHQILVRFEIVEDTFQIEVEDDGNAFNPLERPDPDLTLPLEQRPIGGLGIHLMRQFMDQLSYRRENGKNMLLMKKSMK